MKRLGVCVLGVFFVCVTHSASAVVVDGTRDVAYGGPLAVQTVQTEFGDNESELDAAYARVEGGDLYLMLTGNLQDNFNKLNIFFDSKPGGQNEIFGALNPTNDGWAATHDFFTFDEGFEADYMVILRNGSFEGDRFDVDYAIVGGAAGDYDDFVAVFGNAKEGSGSIGPGPSTGITMDVGFDNSNILGVAGGTLAADPVAAAAVTTGVELKIPLGFLGSPAGDIKISAMVNASNHDFLSNQFLGGLEAPQSNLGGDGFGTFTGNVSGVNLTDFTGDQFFVVSTTPALTGDGNGDGWVDGLDYLIWASNFGTHLAVAGGPGDYNNDTWVDGLDYLDWAANFGTHAAAAVPEPGTFVLAGLALVGLLAVRRRG